MYRVVGCRNCRFLWTVEGRPETTHCPRCRTRHGFEKLRSFAETETSAAASRFRSSMLAERADGEFVDPETIDVDAVGMDEVDFLAASGDDADAIEAAETRAEKGTNRSRSRKRVVLDGLNELDEPTPAELIAYAARADVEESYVERTLEKLVRSGEITRTTDGYRKV